MRIGFLAGIIAACIGFIILGDYHTEPQFLLYRLAFNVNQGHGIVYNSGDWTLLTLSPLSVLPVSLSPQHAAFITAILSITGYAASAGLLYPLLKQHGFDTLQAVSIIGIWLLSWTTWTGFRSPDSITFAAVLMTIHLLHQQKQRHAGLLLGFAVLYQAQAIIPLIILGLYRPSRRYWQMAILPPMLWIVVAWLVYNHLILPFDLPSAGWQDVVWLGLFIGSVIVFNRQQLNRIWWIFPLWAATQLITLLMLGGDLYRISSLPISLTVAIGATHILSQPIMRYGAIVAAFILLLVFPPQTPDVIQADIDALTISHEASIAHTRSDAFAYDFEGHVHRLLDGERSPAIDAFIERGDLVSAIIMTAPDYVFLDEPIEFTQPGLAALDYVGVTDHLWERQSTLSEFNAPIETSVAFGPEVTLTAYQADHIRLNPGDVLRLRLDWSLFQAPEDYDVTLNISLLDSNQTPIVTIFPVVPGRAWQDLDLSTFHALRLPEEITPGIYGISVTVDYRASILGRHVIGNLVAPFRDVAVTEPYGTLGEITLYDVVAERDENQLNVTLNWSANQPTDRPYSVFVHLSPIDDLAPARQADGPPLSGSYPTTYWYNGDVIQETRQLDLTDLPAGEYRINIGFYADDGTRLTGESGDFLTPLRITLTETGEVITAPFE